MIGQDSLKIEVPVPLFFWRDLRNLLPIIWEKQDFVVMSNLVLIMLFFSESFLLAKANLIKSVIVSRTILLCLPKLFLSGADEVSADVIATDQYYTSCC
jgi:hypothetical protein